MGITEAYGATSDFASRYQYRIVGWYQDVTDLPLPGPDSAFDQLLHDLDSGLMRVVLVSAREWLAPTSEAQRRMAAMVAGHGGTLITVDVVEALGIAPAGLQEVELFVVGEA